MKYSFIAIEREYGSGGTKIAEALAKKCQIPCYGSEILEMVSNKFKISTDRIEKYEESAKNSFLYSVFMISKLQSGNPDMLTEEGQVYITEQNIIKDLAAKGPAVFLGHCASEALKDRTGVLKVFIRCSEKEKQKRIIEDYKIPESDVNEFIKKFDRKRANYYYANTMKKWDDLNNYDIVLNSSELGIRGCVNALKGLILDF